MRRLAWQSVLALVLCLAGAAMLPLANAVSALPFTIGQTAAIELLLLASVIVSVSGINPLGGAVFLFFAVHIAAFMLVIGIAGNEGGARASFFLLLVAAWLLAWRLNVLISGLRPESKGARNFQRLIVPTLFGVWILILWEGITRGAGIPFVLLPPPTSIAARFANSLPILGADLVQTVLKSVLAGYVIGCGAGFVVAILADRVPFLRKGMLPIGNVVSALPIIGIAPIMVMWFGFDWPSKAAVVVVMTFFPMLVNTVAGLAVSGHMERDLMRTYASSYWQTLFKLRLPAAAPFIFNALKINSTLALIGAIVAEFFGTPIVGMGFRISTEVGRMNIDMVWAEIAVAAIAGSIFYGVVALVERAVTFWHPSIRGG
jgi:NitT/TauT family transport system permease protein